MASEAVNAVLGAEKENDKKIASANEKSRGIIADAGKRAAEIIESSVSEAKKQAQQILSDANEAAAGILSGKESEINASTSQKVDEALYKSAVEAVRAKALEL